MDKQQNRSRMWKNAAEKVTHVDFWPPAMDIEVTSYCNYACRMCPHALTGNRVARHLRMPVLRAMERYLPYCRKISLQGDGEPFLNPEIQEIISFLRQYDIQLMTTTNLSLLDDRLARLVGQAFQTITISCDGCTAPVYESIRQNGSFANFVENLDRFQHYAREVTVIMNCVLMRQNIHQAADMVHFAAAHGIRELVFSALLTDADLKNEADSLQNYPALTTHYLQQAQQAAWRENVHLTISWDWEHSPCSPEAVHAEQLRAEQADSSCAFTAQERDAFIKRYLALKQIETPTEIPAGRYHCEGICQNLFGKTFLDTDGNVTVCCFGKLHPIGNVLQTDFAEIWNGPLYQQLRQCFFTGQLPNFCIGCKYSIAAQTAERNEYPFRILDMDEAYIQDKAFWNNRQGGKDAP